MTAPTYLDFHLLVYPTDAGYRAYVMGAPGGDASATFSQPLTTEELDAFARELGGGRRRGVGGQPAARRRDATKAVGDRLYSAVFAGELGRCLRSSIDEAKRQKKGLRIRLNLTEAPDLADLPWEFLYDASLDRFIGLSTETPIVRYLALPERAEPLAVALPLRVLVVISSPEGHQSLDAAQEWSRIGDALDDLVRAGRITLERMEEATMGGLQQKLRQGNYHILHFIGHGGFDPESQEGVLMFEDEAGRAARVTGDGLGRVLRDHAAMRLVVLNSCEGARSSRADPFSGVAQSLVRQGIPSVVAMQFEITDQAAVVFAHEFYKATSDGYPVEAAVAEGRKAISTSEPGLEWGIPVLHLRAPDGYIFHVEHAEAERQTSPGILSAMAASLGQVPRWVWALVAMELLTYLFFALFFFPGRGEETFRQVVTDYRWQVVSTFECCVMAGVVLLLSARKRAAAGGLKSGLAGVTGAVLLIMAPLGLYVVVRPRMLPEMRVDTFYLDYDRSNRAEGFDEARLRALLADAGRLVNVTFNWVDWRDWSSGELRRAPIERLSGLAALHARRSALPAPSAAPVGITSTPLEGNEFWIAVRGVNLKVISAADWARFAPPSTEEYLLHAILLTTLEYRLNNTGSAITEHSAEEFQKFYFDGVRDKAQMRELICAGRFRPDDERIIRRALGRHAFDAYEEALSLTWLMRTTCPPRRPP